MTDSPANQNAPAPAVPASQEAGPGGLPVVVRVALIGTLTSALAILAAIGIQGDVLGRLIRNQSLWFAFAVALVFVGATIPILVSIKPTSESPWSERFNVLGSLVLLGGIIWLVFLGVTTLALRDQPVINLASTMNSDGSVSISADASGGSLQAREKMLMTVMTVDGTYAGDLTEACNGRVSVPRDDTDAFRYVYWGETGPSTAGSATDNIDVALERGKIRWVCGRAALYVLESDRARETLSANEQKTEERRMRNQARGAVAIIDLQSIQRPEAVTSP